MGNQQSLPGSTPSDGKDSKVISDASSILHEGKTKGEKMGTKCTNKSWT